MGRESPTSNARLTPTTIPPDADEIEVTLFGPGYGECILIHVGDDRWVIIDSCIDNNGQPRALAYLRDIGLNPSSVVCLVVATHWHDDHIRGLAELVRICESASFCCASTLLQKEFLSILGALERRPATSRGSGLSEMYKVFSLLAERSIPRKYAIATRVIFDRDRCRIWSLSPSDKAFEIFLQQVGSLIPEELEPKRRVPSMTPNEAAVVLLFTIEEVSILLGADLEKGGWVEILETHDRPDFQASVFKIPHHGSKDAHVDRVWDELLCEDPIAILTPWRRGGKELPRISDVQRILTLTSRAFVTGSRGKLAGQSIRKRSRAVEKTIKESGVKISSVSTSNGMIRLRKRFNSQSDWDIQTFGSGRPLTKF